ncbi:DUF2794 domain-containing protein [Methylobacterium sp. sgz302541]|uniref:DUF2794 domain-containing protein n=1 Tax=unclassified Methylobacterium TaxID=2615210 RepID=UPI003D33A3E8
MSERTSAEPRSSDHAGSVVPFPGPSPTPQSGSQGAAQIAFDRQELRTIFNLYGRMVAEGEWRDYALDFRRDKAVFSIYRRTSEMPLYRVEKDPKLARRQGAYAVVAATGLVMKRGTDLARVLSVLEKPLRAV